MSKEYIRETSLKMIFCAIMFVPILLYIIAQIVLGSFSMVSMVVLVLVVGIIGFNFVPRKALVKNVNKKYKGTVNVVTPTGDGIKYTHASDTLNIQMSEAKQRPLATRLVSIALGVVMLGVGLLMYIFFVKKIYDADAVLVDATVVNVRDLSYKDVVHTDKGTEVTEHNSCEVTFAYTLDGQHYELVKTFNGISSFKAKTISIYISDGEFVATSRIVTFGIVFAIYYLLLAILNFARSFYATDLIASLVGTLFASIGGLLIQTLQVSFLQMFFNSFGALILLLTICGIGILFSNVPTIKLYSRTTKKFSASVSSK